MLETRYDIRVDWGHCDPAQIVYNPNFVVWMEHGVNVLFEAAGHALSDLIRADPNRRGLPLVKSEASFMAPARFGEVLVLSSRVTRFGRTSFDIGHRFTRGDTVIAEGKQIRVWSVADPDDPDAIRAEPLPAEIRAGLEEDRIVTVRTFWQG
ncbi:acyl-CoA thioesterase [Amorphus coralli]|uniref:acyl-CoA thioesterase n=1 Tax=Amorphus coralli TaxID=340680 RepID=UPI000427C442|nr:thioesterase family protein [Amorphus coralli]